MFKAVGYLLPAATGAAAWAHPELEPPGGDLWVPRPAAEQLDSIAG